MRQTKRCMHFLCAILAVVMLLPTLTACQLGEGKDDREDENKAPANHPSTYVIYYGDSCKIAAYTLSEVLSRITGTVLAVRPISEVADEGYAICFYSANESDVGNYGYAIDADEKGVTIKAATLAGFDKAIERLVSDCVSGQTMEVPKDYTVSENLNWETEYVLDGEDYNPDYNGEIFYNDKNDSVAYVSNAMWHMFGLIDDGQDLVYRFGNEPTWFEWMSEKLMWSGDTSYIGELKGKLRSFPQVKTGYMWSWGTYPYWKVDNCYSIHYDGTFRYIAAVYDVISWEGNTNFLKEIDRDTVDGSYANLDASNGRTVLEKTEACMNYILEYLHGNEGYIQLTEQSTYLNADGSERFDYVIDTGKYCWDNTGKDGSAASNYWDNLCFGNYDGYSGALFYNALCSMAGIYRMLGKDYVAKAEEMEALAVTVKEKFNELYWSEETGRYIACIDTDGRKVDFGLTFHNFEILKYGLADAERAKSIFDWVDGDRIIEGEARTGEDIFSYAKLMNNVLEQSQFKAFEDLKLRLAAVTNTIPINNQENKDLGVAWWHAPKAINVWGNSSYGKHLENGGYIFYPVFYELMARTAYEGAQSTTDRLYDISRVYEYNRLKSDVAANGSTNWLEGLIGEFPESGMVPTAYIYSLVGISAEYDGLHLAPAFNDVYEYMGVRELKYGRRTYGIEVNRDGSCTITANDKAIEMTLKYTPERFVSNEYTVTVTTTDGSFNSFSVPPDESGVLSIKLKEKSVASVKIVPVLE